MNVDIFEFPILTPESRIEVETRYCEVLNAYRNGEYMPPEVVDWMDSANNFLIQIGK